MRLRRPRVDTGELQENWQPRLYGRLIVLGLLAAYAIAFVLENRKHVHVHFVFFTASVSPRISPRPGSATQNARAWSKTTLIQ